MSNKTLLTLGVVALVMVIWAVIQSSVSSGPGARPDKINYLLIQGLDTDSIQGIVVGAGEEKVTLKRRGRAFVAADKDDYPAEMERVNSLISDCIGIQTVELYTDDASNHEVLEVTEGKARSLVKFLKSDDALIAGVAIGKNRETGEGSYVRLLPGDKVYVTMQSPWIRSRAVDYVDQEILSVKRDDIVSVTVASKDGEYTLRAGDADSVTLENVPAGKKLKSSDARTVLSSVTSIRFDDVKKDARFDDVKKDGNDLTFEDKFVCRLKDSTVYTLEIAKRDEKTYVTCSAEFTDANAVEKKPLSQGGQVESQEELKKKEAKLLAKENAGKYTVRHRGWVYEIPDWKANNLTKKLSDLLEDEKKPEEEKVEDPNTAKTVERDPTAVEKSVVVEAVEAVEPGAGEKDDPNATKAVEPNAPAAPEPNSVGAGT
ncbi:MAG: DUF4340 domain-containing protein [Phycisphaerales bacterium]|nr:MAG: DUF4340 domain-containing protein [Phycisphaerales bacterium]